MLAEVKEVRRDGVVLQLHDPQGGPQEAWLPTSEWSADPKEWDAAYEVLEIGEDLDVLNLEPEQIREGRLLVSRKRFTQTAVDSSWLNQPRIMRVEDITRTLFKGKIGSVSAFVPQELYTDFLETKSLTDRARDYAVVGPGDMIGGVVTDISGRFATVELDPGQYLQMREQEEERKLQERQSGQTNLEPLPATPGLPMGTLAKTIAVAISPVLLVEDDQRCRQTIQAVLEKSGVQVHAAGNPAEVRELLLQLPGAPPGQPYLESLRRFRLAIIDANLDAQGTDQSGFRIIDHLQAVPNCRILFITAAHLSDHMLRDWGHLQIHGFLEKPFTVQRLLQAVTEAHTLPATPFRTLTAAGAVPPTEPQPQPPSDTGPSSRPKHSSDISAERALAELASSKPGAVIHVFEIHERSFRARSILPRTSTHLRWDTFRGKIPKSPIKDAAFASFPIDISSAQGNLAHFWTLKMMPYQSFYGVPLFVPGPWRHALVAFHPDENAFDQDFKAAARCCAERVARALERDALTQPRSSEAILAATGIALESFAHELRNDIIPLHAEADNLRHLLAAQADLPPGSFPELQRSILEIAQSADSAIEKVAALSGPRVHKRPVSLQPCLQRAALACRKIIPDTLKHSKRIHIEIPSFPEGQSWELRTTPAALIIVFFNLYLNAAQQIDPIISLRKAGRVWHSCERRLDQAGHPFALVRIHDTGPGIHPDDWERVFEPGYSTKPGGFGLGLYICRHLLTDISEYGTEATLRITRSVLWDGTTFTLTLPLCS